MRSHEERRALTARAWTIAAWVAVAGAVLGAVLGLVGSERAPSIPLALPSASSAGSFAVVVAALSLTPVLMTLGAEAKAPIRGLVRERRQHIRHMLAGRRPLATSTREETHRAVDRALALSAALPVAIGQFALLYVGIAAQQLVPRQDPADSFAPLVVWVLLPTAAVIVPIMARRLRRVRNFLASVRTFDSSSQPTDHHSA